MSADAAVSYGDKQPLEELPVGSARVTPAPASVGTVRMLLRDDLGALAEPVLEDVALVASELLCNAIRYGGVLADGRIAIEWQVCKRGVEVAVTDGGGRTQPVVADPGPTDIGGRGLSIVAGLARRWGVDHHRDGVTVWAVVPLRRRALTLV